MKVLIAEDKPETIQGIVDYCKDNKIDCKILSEFDDVIPELKLEVYDTIILDLKKDPGQDYPGYDIFDQIWLRQFIPVIIFSAYYDNISNKVDHPFVSYFDKSQEENVISQLKKYLNMNEKIIKIREKMNDLFIQSLRFINDKDSNEIQFQRVLIGMKNYLDENQDNIELPADVQYIIMPKYKSLATCDIIETIPQSGQETRYFMIMSPWCEIVQSTNPVELECKIICDNSCMNNESRTRLLKHGNDGGYLNHILLPDCSLFKKKVVDVSKNIIIKSNEISTNSKETDLSKYRYRKIISIASPFRERMISLCYNNRSRIGVPNIDKNSWWKNGN